MNECKRLFLTPFSKQVLVYNGVEVEKLTRLNRRFEGTGESLGGRLPEGETKVFRVITIARLANIKNFGLSFRILKGLAEEGFPFHFTLIGNDDELKREDLEEK